MRHRIPLIVGALFLGLCLGCVGGRVAGDPAIADEASQSQAGAHAHHRQAKPGENLSIEEKFPSKLVLKANAPASFTEPPAVGTHFTCPVSGGVFEVEPHTRMAVYEDRHYAFCCGGCAQDFDSDPAFFVNRVKEAEVVQ
jgi:hypothetical protein